MAEKVTKILDRFYDLVMFICKLLLVADVLITSYAVLGRYVGKYIPFLDDPAWSEEIVLTCMIYMAFLSASLAIRRKAHIRMTSLDDYLPKKVVAFLDVFGDVLVLLFSLMMIKEGWIYCTTLGAKVSYVSLPWLKKFWLYAPIPISGVAMVVFQLEVLIQHIKVLGKKGGAAA